MAEENFPGLVEWRSFLAAVNNESDRGVALSIAEFLNFSLADLLKSYFVDAPSARALLEGFSAPLGDFSSRIKAAHAVGLLNDVQYSDLEVIRKIRNDFAHTWNEVSFFDQRIASLVFRLTPSALDPEYEQQDEGRKFYLVGTLRLMEIRNHKKSIDEKNRRLLQQPFFYFASKEEKGAAQNPQ
jgi:DNA-binding MltR family transcriptional regulator